MKVKQVSYERVVNLGNYESERIGIVLEPSGPNPVSEASWQTMLDKAVEFVEAQLPERKRLRTSATSPAPDDPPF